jgi:hypothetical protein
MSSKAVRDLLSAQWHIKVPGLPLIDADNLDPSDAMPLPLEWARISYPAAADDRISIGSGSNNALWRESGSILMIVGVKSGTGTARALLLAEAIKTAWDEYTGLNGNLRFISITPPTDPADGQSEGEWYRMQVTVSYENDTFR